MVRHWGRRALIKGTGFSRALIKGTGFRRALMKGTGFSGALMKGTGFSPYIGQAESTPALPAAENPSSG